MTEEDESVLRRRRAAKYPMFLDAPIAKTFMSWATQKLGAMLEMGDMSGWQLDVECHQPWISGFYTSTARTCSCLFNDKQSIVNDRGTAPQ